MSTPGPYGYQMQPPPSQPPRRKRHRARNITLAFVGVIAVIIIGGALGGGGSSPAASSGAAPASGGSGASAAPAAAAGSQVGQVVHDGDFAFTVRHVRCGASAAAAVNSDGFGETVPSGARECIVTMRVSDDKNNAQTFFDSNQYGYDAHGRKFSADDNASIFLHGDQDATQVNPGVTITAKLPFQIPAGDKITRLELHDSDFSGGVTVRL